MRPSIVFAVVFSLALPAWADLAPRDVSSCQGREKGVACETDAGEPGTCEAATCSRNDYSQGIPPRHVSYECLKCRKAEAPAPSPVQASASPAAAAPAPVGESAPPAKKGLGCASSGGSLVALAPLFPRRRRPSDGPLRSSR